MSSVLLLLFALWRLGRMALRSWQHITREGSVSLVFENERTSEQLGWLGCGEIGILQTVDLGFHKCSSPRCRFGNPSIPGEQALVRLGKMRGHSNSTMLSQSTSESGHGKLVQYKPGPACHAQPRLSQEPDKSCMALSHCPGMACYMAIDKLDDVTVLIG